MIQHHGCLLDTNVLVYSADLADVKKQDRASAIIKEAMQKRKDYAISTQALTEFANVALKKLHMAPEIVMDYLQFFESITTIVPDTALVRRGVEIKALYGIQFYDAMMVAAAERAEAAELWSEDLNNGQSYCGIRVRNPFC